VRKIVDECYADVVALLEEKREAIEKLAEELLEKETLNLP
jgi:ATP-dependent Zn protease